MIDTGVEDWLPDVTTTGCAPVATTGTTMTSELVPDVLNTVAATPPTVTVEPAAK